MPGMQKHVRGPAEHHFVLVEKLLETVWGFNYFGDTRTVDTHVKALCEHLGHYRKYIQTV